MVWRRGGDRNGEIGALDALDGIARTRDEDGAGGTGPLPDFAGVPTPYVPGARAFSTGSSPRELRPGGGGPPTLSPSGATSVAAPDSTGVPPVVQRRTQMAANRQPAGDAAVTPTQSQEPTPVSSMPPNPTTAPQPTTEGSAGGSIVRSPSAATFTPPYSFIGQTPETGRTMFGRAGGLLGGGLGVPGVVGGQPDSGTNANDDVSALLHFMKYLQPL